MISVLVGKILKECGLKQKELADVLEVPLQRIKRLAGGEAQKFSQAEAEALIRKLHIRGDWLATGEGPMFQGDAERRAQVALDRVGTAAQAAQRLDLAQTDGARIMELLYYVEAGNSAGARRVLAELGGLAPDEAALLRDYRRCTEPARAALLQTAGLLASGNAVQVQSQAPSMEKRSTT